jgi:hypothetical protein
VLFQFISHECKQVPILLSVLLWNIHSRDFRTMLSFPDVVPEHVTSWQNYAVLYCCTLQPDTVRIICSAKSHTRLRYMFPALFRVSQRLRKLPSALSKHPLSLYTGHSFCLWAFFSILIIYWIFLRQFVLFFCIEILQNVDEALTAHWSVEEGLSGNERPFLEDALRVQAPFHALVVPTVYTKTESWYVVTWMSDYRRGLDW